MNKVKSITDVNAHITNVSSEVKVVDGTAVAYISFDNRAFGTITAVKFNATGYNAFGDIVSVNGKESFILIVQDVSIEKMDSVRDLVARLPNSDIRRLELIESQICYADGKVLSYGGKNDILIDAEELNLADAGEREQRRALEEQFGTGFVWKPQELDGGWRCGCGYVNIPGDEVCDACGASKEEVFYAFTEDGLNEAVSKYREAEECRKEAAHIKDVEDAKARRKRNIFIGICVVVGIILAYWIYHASVMAGRTTYSSAEEMKSALQGTYTYYYDGYSGRTANCQLKIQGDTVTLTWRSSPDDSIDSTVKEWNYKNGTFSTFQDYIVTNTGDIKESGSSGYLFEKGGYMPTSSSFSSNYESGYSVLKFSNLSVTSNSSYTICTGKVKNTGNKTYKYIEVKGAFKDKNGNVLDTDWTYAVGSEGLAPEESSEFRLSVTKDYNIESCSVSILDYN